MIRYLFGHDLPIFDQNVDFGSLAKNLYRVAISLGTYVRRDFRAMLSAHVFRPAVTVQLLTAANY